MDRGVVIIDSFDGVGEMVIGFEKVFLGLEFYYVMHNEGKCESLIYLIKVGDRAATISLFVGV